MVILYYRSNLALVEFPTNDTPIRIEREREAMMNNSRNLASGGHRKQTSSGGTTTSGSSGSSGSLKKSPRICRKKRLQLDFING